MSVDINLATINPGTGDPASIFGKNTADLVDIHFLFTFPAPEFVDLDSNRKGLFRHDNSIEVCIDGRTVPVIKRFNSPSG